MLQVVGYTKRTEDGWLYSAKASEELDQYIERFPGLFEYIAKHSKDNDYFEDDVLEPDGCVKSIFLYV